MHKSGPPFPALLILAVACAATAFADPATVKQAGTPKVVVTIPVRGVLSSLPPVKTIPELLSSVRDLCAADKKRILDALESGFVTAVRLETDEDGHSSWLEVSAVGATLSRGESRARFEVPKLELISRPRAPNASPAPTAPAGTPPAPERRGP